MPYRSPAVPFVLDDLDMVDRLPLLPTFVDLTGECPICLDYALPLPYDGAIRGVRGHHPMCPEVRHSITGSAMISSSVSASSDSSGSTMISSSDMAPPSSRT
jgi:hypothetical protein